MENPFRSRQWSSYSAILFVLGVFSLITFTVLQILAFVYPFADFLPFTLDFFYVYLYSFYVVVAIVSRIIVSLTNSIEMASIAFTVEKITLVASLAVNLLLVLDLVFNSAAVDKVITRIIALSFEGSQLLMSLLAVYCLFKVNSLIRNRIGGNSISNIPPPADSYMDTNDDDDVELEDYGTKRPSIVYNTPPVPVSRVSALENAFGSATTTIRHSLNLRSRSAKVD
jgi:hypothetical protein